MKGKIVSGIMLTLLLTSMLTLAFNIQPVESEAAPLLWSYTTGGRIYTIFVCPNNEYVIAVSDDRNVYSLDLATGQKIWNYYTGEWSERVLMSIYSVFVSPDNQYAIAGTASKVYCFNITNGNKIWTYTTGEAWSVFVSPDNKYVIAGSYSGNIFSFDIDNGTLKWLYPAGGYVFSVFVSPDGKYVLAGFKDGVIALDANGNFLWNYSTNGDVPQKSLFISPDSRYVIAGSTGLGTDYGRGHIYALNITNGQQIWNYTATGTPLGGAGNIPVTSVRVSSDSKYVVAGTGNGITHYLNIRDGRLIWNYTTGRNIWDVAISPDGKYVVTASVGSYTPFPYVPPSVFLLRATDGSKIWNYSTPATSISISPDSETIVVGSWDRNVYAFGAPPPTPVVVTATVYINPDTLNLRSRRQWITAYIELPEGYNPEDIDATTILLNETIQPLLDPKYDFVTNSSEYLVDHNGDGILERMVKFNRTAVSEYIYNQGIRFGNVTLALTAQLADGTTFEGSDMIRARMPGDINMDGKVDIKDITLAGRAFGSYPEHPGWNCIADEHEDSQVDIIDIALIAKNFGKTYQ